MLSELVDLAKEASSERRRELLSRIADVFLSDSFEFADRELVMFCDVLIRLLDQVDVDARAIFAEEVADSDRATEALHRRLAEDEIRVAQPVLMRSIKLGDEVLVQLASSQSQEHLFAISRRESLSTAVTDALVEHGENSVLVSVTENPHAEFSPGGFDRLSERAKIVPELGLGLSRRDDLPDEVASRLIALLPPQAAERLQAVMKKNGGASSQVLRKAGTKLAEEKKHRRRQRLESRALVADVRAGSQQLDTVLVKLAGEDRPVDLALVLAEFAGLSESVTNHCLFRVNVEPLALLLKSLEVGEEAVEAIARSWCRRLQLPDSMRERVIATWRSVEAGAAGRVLRFTRVRSASGAAASAGRGM